MLYTWVYFSKALKGRHAPVLQHSAAGRHLCVRRHIHQEHCQEKQGKPCLSSNTDCLKNMVLEWLLVGNYSFEVMSLATVTQPRLSWADGRRGTQQRAWPTLLTVTPNRGWVVCRGARVVKLAGMHIEEKNNKPPQETRNSARKLFHFEDVEAVAECNVLLPFGVFVYVCMCVW